MQHAVQIASDKTNGEVFLAAYGAAFAANLAKGMDTQKAYECVPAEIEGHAMENAINKVLKSKEAQKSFQKACNNYPDENAFTLAETNSDAMDLAMKVKNEYETQKQMLQKKCK